MDTAHPGGAAAQQALRGRRDWGVLPGLTLAIAVAAVATALASVIPLVGGPVLGTVIAVALAGVGLSIDVGGLRRTGTRPLVLGAALWVTVGVSSLALQSLTGL